MQRVVQDRRVESSAILFTVLHVQGAVEEYDKNKGWFRCVWDQAAISKLRSLSKRLNPIHDYLSADETFELMSILLTGKTAQGSASASAICSLERVNENLFGLSCLLNSLGFFSQETFRHVYANAGSLYEIFTHIKNLQHEGVRIPLSYAETIIRYTQYASCDTFLAYVMAQFQRLEMSELVSLTILQKMLQKKVSSYDVLNAVRHTGTTEAALAALKNVPTLDGLTQAVVNESYRPSSF